MPNTEIVADWDVEPSDLLACFVSAGWNLRQVKAGPHPYCPCAVDDTLWISNRGDPHTFPAEVNPFPPDSEGGWICPRAGADITALVPDGDGLIVHTTTGSYRLTGDTWRDWCLTPIPRRRLILERNTPWLVVVLVAIVFYAFGVWTGLVAGR